MDHLFNINWKKIALWFLPTFLRTAKLKALLWMLLFPLELMWIEVLRARKQNLIKMNFNYQKFSVQKRLNDAFDPVERRIRIVNAVIYESVYLYTEAEDVPLTFGSNSYSKTKWLSDGPLYLRTEGELTSEYDFIVEIPNTNINLIQLRAEIDFYILPSKRYTIAIV